MLYSAIAALEIPSKKIALNRRPGFLELGNKGFFSHLNKYISVRNSWIPTYLFLYSSLVSRTALPLVVEEGPGTNPLVGQALVMMMVMHKNHLERVVVEAKDSLHLKLEKKHSVLNIQPSQVNFSKYVGGIGHRNWEMWREHFMITAEIHARSLV